MGAALKNLAKAWALPLVLIAAWQIASMQGTTMAYAFVPLKDIWTSTVELMRGGELPLHLAASIGTALIGLVTGSVAGIALGTCMALDRRVDLLVSPVYHALRQVPTMGLIPIIALWFGTGELSIRLLVAIATFEVMALNTYEGLKGVEQRYRELGRVLTLPRTTTLVRILFPAAFPSILTGLLQAASFAWIATIGAELLFTVGPGLGVIMERAQLMARMDQVIVCLILIGAMGYATNRLCVYIGRRALRWHQPQSK